MADATLHTLNLLVESVWGTPILTGQPDILRLTSCSLGLTRDTVISDELREDRQITDIQLGTHQVGGDCGGEVYYDDGFDTLLEGAFQAAWAGTALKTGNTRSPFTVVRKFKNINAPTPGDGFLQYNGMEVNTLSMSVAANTVATWTAGFIGKEQLALATTNPMTVTDGTPGSKGMMSGVTAVIKQGGTDIAICTEASFSLENGLQIRPVIGNTSTLMPTVGRSVVSGSISAYFENNTLLDLFVNGTKTNLEFELSDSAGNKYTFDFPALRFSGGQADFSGPGSVMLVMPFQGFYDATKESNIVVTKTAAP